MVMSSPWRPYRAQADAGEGRQQHGEVEFLLALRAVDGLVVDAVLVDLADVGAGDPVDAALGEQRFGEQAARHYIAAAPQVHAAHAEVAELVLVGDPGDLRLVPDAAGAQLEFEIDDVLEGRALAGARSVADTDQEPLPLAAAHPLDGLVERGRSLERVLGGAYRQAVAARAEPFGLVEAQPRSGGVDQEVVRNLLRQPCGRLDGHERHRAGRVALGVDLAGRGLLELDPVALVDRRERERHLAGAHQPDPHPDIGRDPVVGLVRRYHGHRVIAAQPLPGERSGGVAGYTGPEDHDTAHREPPVRVLIPPASGCDSAGSRDHRPAGEGLRASFFKPRGSSPGTPDADTLGASIPVGVLVRAG